MKKCIHCGKSILLGGIQLKDAVICKSCFRKLGFDKDYELTASVLPYDDIKDGFVQYIQNKMNKAVADSVSVKMTYGERDLVCTEEERRIYDNVCDFLGLDLRLVRLSDNYVTIKYRDWDLVRMKFTNRASWVMFPVVEQDRHEIEDPDDVLGYADELTESIEHIKKYS